jgi:hypothetical protein
MAYRVLKQLFQAPSSSVSDGVTFRDPPWAVRNVYIASSSTMPLWEFDNEDDADTKATELSEADSSGREYIVVST